MTGKRASFHPAFLICLALASAVLGIIVAQFLPQDLFGFENQASLSTVQKSDHGHDDGQLWSCGMHPHILEDEPGQCPICGMNLTPLLHTAGIVSPVAPAPPAAAASWSCPDHSNIVEESPGTCPIDGLDLVPVSDSPSTSLAAVEPDEEGGGETIVTIDPAVVQNMNVRTERAIRRDLIRPIRTVGYLEFDQQRMVTVTTKYSGWVEKVYVNYVGEKVLPGQPLFEIYSPELVQTEQELLSALDFAREMEAAPEDARQRALSMVDSARLRLGYWDIAPQQIARLEATGEVFRTLEVRAPSGGVVMKRMVGLEGMAVQPGMELFHVADLSSLWLSVELFEDQLAAVSEGTSAEITLPYFPGEAFRGKVRFLEPELSEKTRTLRAKIEVPNQQGRLRKGMYATVRLEPVSKQHVLAVPLEAVLRTGQRNVVVEALGGGRFVPREVVLGHEASGFVEVLGGLEDDSLVVTSAQFLLDSESTLRGAIAKMIAQRSAASSGN